MKRRLRVKAGSVYALLTASEHIYGDVTGLQLGKRISAQCVPECLPVTWQTKFANAAVPTPGADRGAAPETFAGTRLLSLYCSTHQAATDLREACANVFRHIEKSLSIQSVNERWFCRNCS